ncbi:hypothetical protein [Paenibacillus azoreducens]|uniref:Phage gp6-like head-tail connector protein n=1 Tax=Paenibacillus azoreducens TaxID=116718 RepID=A0A920CTY1_9BACL|nr:hypothetical protein [Paenibacillus azoreducens]GIO48852.1 hypothetical protein J34TS1_36170 [Paenibacillus azoreducens]
MDVEQVLGLVKERLGIRSNVRDSYITAIVQGVITELEDEQGLKLEADNFSHLLFVCDFVTWRYQSVSNSETNFTGQPISMPRHLQFRLHNLIIHVGGGKK